MQSVYPVDFTEWQVSQPRVHKAQKDISATEQIQIISNLKQNQMGESEVIYRPYIFFSNLYFTFL